MNDTAQASCPLIGTWSLVSVHRNAEDGTRQAPGPGWEKAIGYVGYTADGRMFAHLSLTNKAPIGYPDIDDQKRIEAHKSMVSYTGTYDYYGDHVLHHVDIAWIPDWEGKDQRREVTLDGDSLTLTTPFGRRPDGSMGSFSLQWQRIS